MAEPAKKECVSSMGIHNGRITAIGDETIGHACRQEIDARGKIVLPGFVDCHTHLCYAGNRLADHAARLEGKSYSDIARGGGGILSTVRALHDASEDQLVQESLPRLHALGLEGVTTVEIKSGYGLSTEQEIKQLRAIRRLAQLTPLNVVPTFLALHALPAEMNRAQYVDDVIEKTLPEVALSKLARCVDAFCDSIAFSPTEVKQLFSRARQLGLRYRIHSDQIDHLGGTQMAAQAGALSCDHLEQTQASDVAAMAANGTIAVLLPGAYYFLGASKRPPINEFRRLGVPMAIGTDLNPGSSPIASPLTILHFASNLFGLTAHEALSAFTCHAASALGCQGSVGALVPGARADFTFWDIPGPEYLVYQLGGIKPDEIYIAGRKFNV